MQRQIPDVIRREGVHFDVIVITDERSTQVVVQRGPALEDVPVHFGTFMERAPRKSNIQFHNCDDDASVHIDGATLPVVVRDIIKHKHKKALRARVAVVNCNGKLRIEVLVPKRTRVDVVRHTTTVERAEVPVRVVSSPEELEELLRSQSGSRANGRSGQRTNGATGGSAHQGNGQGSPKSRQAGNGDARQAQSSAHS